MRIAVRPRMSEMAVLRLRRLAISLVTFLQAACTLLSPITALLIIA